MKRLIYILIALAAFTSCSEIEWKVYDHPYVYVKYANDLNNSETSTVLSLANTTKEYTFILSSKKRETPLTVDFEIVPGDGLTAGVDYELQQEFSSVVFEPGEYTKNISIKYLKRKVDKTMDNTITIRILGADEEISIGIPGNPPKNASHIVTKKN